MTKKCPLNNFKECLKSDCAWFMRFEGFSESSKCSVLIIGQVIDTIPSAIKSLQQ